MDKNTFWMVLVIIVVAALALGFVFTNSNLTGKAAQQPPTILPVTCTDSDGGWNLGLKGTCRDGNSTINWTDNCFTQGNTTFLREYYCMNGYCNSTPYNCGALGARCVNGACVGGNATNYSAITGISPDTTLSEICGQLGGGIIIDYKNTTGCQSWQSTTCESGCNYPSCGSGCIPYSWVGGGCGSWRWWCVRGCLSRGAMGEW